MITGDRRVFWTHDIELSFHNGEIVVILRPLDPDVELGLVDGIAMYKVFFPSGSYVLDVFIEELHTIPHTPEMGLWGRLRGFFTFKGRSDVVFNG